MDNKVYTIQLGKHTVLYCFRFPDTYLYFGGKAQISEDTHYDIQMSDDHFSRCREILGEADPNGYVECKGLVSLTSQYLLQYSCCIFHAVSFIYKGYAWLLTAKSGTGKTTQYMNWNRLFPGEITMISGDMPLLEMCDSSRIMVHPTPWNGKENIGTDTSAPLGGIIYLKQGPENCIEKLPVHEGLLPVFKQFQTIRETEEDIYSLSALADCIFRNYPVWRLTNLGNDDSTKLLRNTIDQWEAR